MRNQAPSPPQNFHMFFTAYFGISRPICSSVFGHAVLRHMCEARRQVFCFSPFPRFSCQGTLVAFHATQSGITQNQKWVVVRAEALKNWSLGTLSDNQLEEKGFSITTTLAGAQDVHGGMQNCKQEKTGVASSFVGYGCQPQENPNRLRL